MHYCRRLFNICIVLFRIVLDLVGSIGEVLNGIGYFVNLIVLLDVGWSCFGFWYGLCLFLIGHLP